MKKRLPSDSSQLELFQRETDLSAPKDDCSESLPSVSCDLDSLFDRLSESAFRSRFHLRETDRRYIAEKGLNTIRFHAYDFIAKRLAPAIIPNDGRQTPMRGHPVFVAQHATGCCCRGCLSKWHHIPTNRQLTGEEQRYIATVLMAWIERETTPSQSSQKQTSR
jgi:exodeoxyribonuclease V alpha subunit